MVSHHAALTTTLRMKNYIRRRPSWSTRYQVHLWEAHFSILGSSQSSLARKKEVDQFYSIAKQEQKKERSANRFTALIGSMALESSPHNDLATIVQWDQNHGMTKKEKKIELVYCLYYLSTIL